MRNLNRIVQRRAQELLNRIGNSPVRTNLLQGLPFWIASILTGMLAVAYALLFGYAERLTHVAIGYNKAFLFVLTPFCFWLAWWMVQRGAPFARGSGIPQVMAAMEYTQPGKNGVLNRLLGIRIILVKIASSLVLVLGGGAIGREGPTIQVAASVFAAINKRIPATWPRLADQSYIITGAAAGLAAAFNTPLGGLVFAMEELARIHVRFFRTALFVAVIIAGLTAQGLLGPYLYLGYPDVRNLSYRIFLGVVVVALLSGIAGAVLSRMILWLIAWKRRVQGSFKPWQYAIAAGLLTAAFAFWISTGILGSGKELMTGVLFAPNKEIDLVALVGRFAGPLLAFSTGAAGGIFAPALAAGAAVGGFVAHLFVVGGTHANILVLAGMVGLLTGVTRTPFTSAILVLEMTDRHSVIFHLLVAGLVAQLVALLVDKHSFYDHLKQGVIQELEKKPAS
ncbi:H+/Cl-antiporter ClcA [Cnuella takakiae]|uniref:H+/Cl-antiporter ClcA n=1 Tax=Cnuella takakiae TaxID=1302690 RepID=A0A1M5IXD1_9BACT|nr:chloride channel protein [Cnuella takakiae]OLY91421.1 chloride channel protein [Cnuella takakiae]SHG33018.1 H+/Cl-antiporter ClcA [Cnuella takakiae]